MAGILQSTHTRLAGGRLQMGVPSRPDSSVLPSDAAIRLLRDGGEPKLEITIEGLPDALQKAALEAFPGGGRFAIAED